MRILFSVVFVFIAVAVQHVIHEYSHVLAAKIVGVKVVRIQWLTYSWGSRVFYENEPTYESLTNKKWAFIAGAGYIITNTLAYIFILIYHFLPFGWVKAFVSMLLIVFLLGDSTYFTLGSMLNFGDIIGIIKTMNISKRWAIFFCGLILIFNILIVKVVLY